MSDHETLFLRDFHLDRFHPRVSLPSPSMADNESPSPVNGDLKRDSYGFTVRPQHLEIYREYSHIYKEEEKERSEKWKNFIEHYGESVPLRSPTNKCSSTSDAETTNEKTQLISDGCQNGNDCSAGQSVSSATDGSGIEVPVGTSSKPHKIQIWIPIRPPMVLIEKMMMDGRVKSTVTFKDDHTPLLQKYSSNQHDDVSGVACQVAHQQDNSYQVNTSSFPQKETERDVGNSSNENSNVKNHATSETLLPSKEELEFLVRGGVPKHLRGEIWQAFIGVQTRHVNKYYQSLVSSEMDTDHPVPEKIKKQIEKDLSRTFPGHPALDEDGRNSLRRILTAYARHNPSVGYCQAMNFFAGLFLLLMPEENAFWALVGIIDDEFDGYYTYDMIESQVDQLVFEELMRGLFPKLVNHLDYLGVQVTWITSPWFISIFANMLPWETVLRIWDVLLFEGNRVMLFRSALALMELYGPVIITTKDAGEAMTLLQSLAASTFDSSHLVITACMSFLAVNEDRLQELRNKHRPSVLEIIEERTRGSRVSKESKSIATKLSSFKHGPQGVMKMAQGSGVRRKRTMSKIMSANNFDEFICSISTGPEQESVPDLQDQVALLKAGISNLQEEKRLANMRAEELETAFTEMLKEDNRQQLSARVEQLEYEVAELQKILASKEQQEASMLKVLMRMEQQQKATEDVRLAAEQEASSQRCAAQLLQEKYEKTMASLAQMEKKVVMAESLLEATRQYQSGQAKALSSPRIGRYFSERSARKTSLLNFGSIWSDKNKGKPSNVEKPGERG